MYGRYHKTSSDFLPPTKEENKIWKNNGNIVNLRLSEFEEKILPPPRSPHLLDLNPKIEKQKKLKIKKTPNLLNLRRVPSSKQKANKKITTSTPAPKENFPFAEQKISSTDHRGTKSPKKESTPGKIPRHPMLSEEDLEFLQRKRRERPEYDPTTQRPIYPFADKYVPKKNVEKSFAPKKSKYQLTSKKLSPGILRIKKRFTIPLFLNPFALCARNKSLASFVLICLLISSTISLTAFLHRFIALKEKVMDKANIAYAQLNDAQEYLGSQNYDLASSSFGQASSSFNQSVQDTQEMGKVITQILELMPLSFKITQGPKILRAGEYLATTGEYLALTIKPFQNLDPIYAPDSDYLSAENQTTLTQAIVESHDNLKIAVLNLEKAKQELAKVNTDGLDQEIKDKINFLQQTLPPAYSSLDQIYSFSDHFLEILGHNRPKRYLLLFQNNNEIRATGGFIGSYGILELNEGKIQYLEVDGIYNPDGQVLEKITPPDPIRFTNTRWHARDANWFPDFPTSAQKVAWFLERGGKPTVDGVIALTPNVIIDLLNLTDTIEMPEYDTDINAENFVIQTQREVELEYDQEKNRPKKFLADLAPKILERILNSEQPQWLALMSIFSKQLNEKHLLFYFFDEELQNFALEKDWAGEIKNSSQDYLMVVNNNINGGKTDGMIQETINLETTIHLDGSIVNAVTITRDHRGNFEWPSINNINYLRLYVPEGSTLLSASGFDIVNLPTPSYEEMQYSKDPQLEKIRSTSKKDENSRTVITQEFGKTCFGNWISVRPQESATVTFKYKLPFKINPQTFSSTDKYTILIQKQSGSFGSVLDHQLKLPSTLEAVWKYPENVSLESDQEINWSTILTTDKFFGVALEKK